MSRLTDFAWAEKEERGEREIVARDSCVQINSLGIDPALETWTNVHTPHPVVYLNIQSRPESDRVGAEETPLRKENPGSKRT